MFNSKYNLNFHDNYSKRNSKQKANSREIHVVLYILATFRRQFDFSKESLAITIYNLCLKY